MKILVTGGAGFIGSNFIRYWLNEHKSDSIINYDALTYAGCLASLVDVKKEAKNRYNFVNGSIVDYNLVLKTLKKHRPDAIVNFAAESHNSRAILNPGIFVETNVLGTQRLLDAAREVGTDRFHHISTCEVYGDLALDADEKFNEESPYKPKTPYSASKASAEIIIKAYFNTFKLPITISNCANNYGPYQFPEKLIPFFTIKGLAGEKMPLYKQSKNKREWIHVLDHCRGIEAILTSGKIGETYNIGTDFEADVETVAEIILEALGLDQSTKSYVEDRPSHDRRYLLDSTKIRQELGWQPSIEFKKGLRETIKWYQNNQIWWQPLLKKLIQEDSWKKK
jgi:dTDP-glucose 4,6-dehydratase